MNEVMLFKGILILILILGMVMTCVLLALVFEGVLLYAIAGVVGLCAGHLIKFVIDEVGVKA